MCAATVGRCGDNERAELSWELHAGEALRGLSVGTKGRRNRVIVGFRGHSSCETDKNSNHKSAVPASPILEYLESLRARFVGLADGKVADYIPELSHADPDWFGICIATRDGFVYEVGDSRQPFTLQSISKPLTYGLVLEENGEDTVLAKIGVEPSGEAFNAISLRPQTGAPLNPLINAGAIAACGLIQGDTAEAKIARVLGAFSRYAGRALDIDERVYNSESATGHRNRAIGWMLRNFAILGNEPSPTLETYFRQCSIRVTCRDLALMGATLANGGVNPVSGVRALAEEYVDNVLSVMATCGMYDYSGEWLYRTGLPAKSGVGGGILAVQPGRLGIGVFSPRLDPQGNSVRGIAVCRALAAELGLHLFDAAQPRGWAMWFANIVSGHVSDNVIANNVSGTSPLALGLDGTHVGDSTPSIGIHDLLLQDNVVHDWGGNLVVEGQYGQLSGITDALGSASCAPR